MLNNIHILSRTIVGRKGFEPPQPITILDPKSSASQPIAPPPQYLMYKLYLWIKPGITFTSNFCGPEGNRTLHDLLAREFRQPWNMRAQNTHLTFNSTFTTNYRMSLRVLVNHFSER